MQHIPRKISTEVLDALRSMPIVFLNGARQVGKSTLVQMLAHEDFPADYITFDDTTQMAAAASSPSSFLKAKKGAVILDEVQMVPELFRPLKSVVDELRLKDKASSNGRFLLTGSANIMALPKLADPLVGRMSVKTLYPFSACEVLNGKGSFLTSLFACDFSEVTQPILTLNDAMKAATFPEISDAAMEERSEWLNSYLTTILQRDVRMISELEKVSLLPRLLQILAARAGKLLNDADIARDIALNPVTSKSYRGILRAMFLTFDVSPWYRNIGKRLVKSAKGYLMDTLLLCHLLDVQIENARETKPQLFGHIVENFVATELIKLLSFSNTRAKLLHFRTGDNKEVDFVLEKPDGGLAAIEVKTSDTVTMSDFKGLKILQELTPADFQCGIVLYAGKDVVPFGEKLFAVPFRALWQ